MNVPPEQFLFQILERLGYNVHLLFWAVIVLAAGVAVLGFKYLQLRASLQLLNRYNQARFFRLERDIRNTRRHAIYRKIA